MAYALVKIKDGIKEDKCEICGFSIWQGVKLPLELHHKMEIILIIILIIFKFYVLIVMQSKMATVEQMLVIMPVYPSWNRRQT